VAENAAVDCCITGGNALKAPTPLCTLLTILFIEEENPKSIPVMVITIFLLVANDNVYQKIWS